MSLPDPWQQHLLPARRSQENLPRGSATSRQCGHLGGRPSAVMRSHRQPPTMLGESPVREHAPRLPIAPQVEPSRAAPASRRGERPFRAPSAASARPPIPRSYLVEHAQDGQRTSDRNRQRRGGLDARRGAFDAEPGSDALRHRGIDVDGNHFRGRGCPTARPPMSGVPGMGIVGVISGRSQTFGAARRWSSCGALSDLGSPARGFRGGPAKRRIGFCCRSSPPRR